MQIPVLHRSTSAMCAFMLFAANVGAAQIDITGPAGSVAFGTNVVVLPNGNIVVTDPLGVVSSIGAVYLYSPNGDMISELTGSSSNDNVGIGGITVLSTSDFVVKSPNWNNGSATGAGAVTWIDGTVGLSGVVSFSNSLVGSTAAEYIGSGDIIEVAGGNYVVGAANWANGTPNSHIGAAIWCASNGTTVGSITLANSLHGSVSYDSVGNHLTALSNGNYVVRSTNLFNGSAQAAGAATWGDGTVGIRGGITALNSLLGTVPDEQVGSRVYVLNNGNYVVGDPAWPDAASDTQVGAAVWGNGSSGVSGLITTSNALVGTVTGDRVGQSVTPLNNGNYVVGSPNWNNGIANKKVGSVTWINGTTGLPRAAVSSSNSLIGTTQGDMLSSYGIFALSNHHYVVDSPLWNNGVAANNFGAVTWANGISGATTGPVSAANSLVGTTVGDQIGAAGITPLSNGNYAVSSKYWNNGVPNKNVGAVTLGLGASGVTKGAVTTSNSLFGTSAQDSVGSGGAIALSNGNFVALSPSWTAGIANSKFGAATWSGGAASLTGPITASNSLVGTTTGDRVGAFGAVALQDGNYVVLSPYWNNGIANGAFGAVTWGNGLVGVNGNITVNNSLVGTAMSDQLGYEGTVAFGSDDYAVLSGAGLSGPGSASFANGRFGLVGTVQLWNSVIGHQSGDPESAISFDASRQRLAVGRPSDNIVSLFTMDQIFNGRFE